MCHARSHMPAACSSIAAVLSSMKRDCSQNHDRDVLLRNKDSPSGLLQHIFQTFLLRTCLISSVGHARHTSKERNLFEHKTPATNATITKPTIEVPFNVAVPGLLLL